MMTMRRRGRRKCAIISLGSWCQVPSFCYFPSLALLLLPSYSFDTGAGGATLRAPPPHPPPTPPPPLSSISSSLRHQSSGHGMLLLIQPNSANLSPHRLLIVVCPIIIVPPPLWSLSSSSSSFLSSLSCLLSSLLLSSLSSLLIAHAIGQQQHLCLCQHCQWDGLCHAPPPPPVLTLMPCLPHLLLNSLLHPHAPLTVITIIG